MNSQNLIPTNTFIRQYPLVWLLLKQMFSINNPLKIIEDTIIYIKLNVPLDGINTLFLKILYNLDKLIKKNKTLLTSDTIILKEKNIILSNSIKLLNKHIIHKDWLSANDFLKAIQIVAKPIYYRGKTDPVLKYLFPHHSNSQPLHRVADALDYAVKLLIAEPSSKIKLFSIKDLFSSKPLPTIGEDEILSIVLHDTRRHTHSLPKDAFISWLCTALEHTISINFINVSSGIGRSIYTFPILSISCPICVENNANCKTCIDHNILTCDKKHCAHCVCKKSHSCVVQLSMKNICKLPTRFPDIDISQLPTRKNFNDAMINVSRADNRYLHFNCSQPSCRYSNTPYIIQVSSECRSCACEYRNKRKTTYHHFSCPGCKKNACALCCKSSLEHFGETLICSKKIIRSIEEITEARTSGIRFCPFCDIPTMLTDGCDHITCASCNEHWCFACEKHLPIDRITGSRYTHICTQEPVGRIAWARDDEPLPNEFRTIPEINPAVYHQIGY